MNITKILHLFYNSVKNIDFHIFCDMYNMKKGVVIMDKVDSVELAKYIVCKMAERGENINHLKLQKLLYYVQVWHLVYSDEPLIDEDFEAWLHGPVLRSVWNYYRTFSIMLDTLPCKEYKLKLTKEQEEIIADVLDEYGSKSGYYLECLTHEESPWQEARRQGENTKISKEAIKEFYSKLIDVK